MKEMIDMLERRDIRKTPPSVMKTPASRTDGNLGSLATKMFVADGKSPYYKGDMTIRNLDELDRNIALFEHHEAKWVADWLEYLGDAQTANKIRAEPSHFRRIVHDRSDELRKNYQ